MLLNLFRLEMDGQKYSYKTIPEIERSLRCTVDDDVLNKLDKASLTSDFVPVKIEDGRLTIWE